MVLEKVHHIINIMSMILFGRQTVDHHVINFAESRDS
jgi:hypothetical protein